MIVYFSGTGNSLAIARQIGEALGEQTMPLHQAVQADLSSEKVVGLVYPSYYFNAPEPVLRMVKELRINSGAYVFIIIPCGAQTGRAIWSVTKILKEKGVEVAYCHKIRVPDCSAIGFGRNPNDQAWKFERFAPRLEQIVSDLKARKHAHHFGGWSLAGWLCALPWMQKKTLPLLQPAVHADKCVGCGTCKRVCTQGNISLVEAAGRTQPLAVIGDHCAQCLSCVHFCPQQAVEIAGKPTLRERQYHHPKVKVADMVH